jgi:hypothetical protein
VSLSAFCERVAKAEHPIQAWVACTVVDRVAVRAEQQLTIVEIGEEPLKAETQCRFPGVVEARLDRTYRAEINFDETVGASLALLLRAVPGEVIQIVDVEPAWVEEEIRGANRASMRDFADNGLLGLQRSVPDPDTIDRVCIIVDEDDPARVEAQRRLANIGVATTVELAEFDGGRGRLSLIMALNRAQSRAAAGEIDLVLVIQTGMGRDGTYALHDDYAAELVCKMGVPVILGVSRPPLASLLHAVAFAAYDGTAEAIEVVLGLVWSAP